jgi:hypothetical protein
MNVLFVKPRTTKEWLVWSLVFLLIQPGTMYYSLKVLHWNFFLCIALAAMLAGSLACAAIVLLRKT